MPPLQIGLLCGIGFGTLAVLLMLPLKFANKRDALLAAFASRFAIGLLVPNTLLPWPPTACGALIGLLVSLPDALVTRAYAPILVVGVAGGALVGWLGAVLA